MHRTATSILTLILLSACGTSDLATSPTAISFATPIAPSPAVQAYEVTATSSPTPFPTRLPAPTPKPQSLLAPISSISFVDDNHGWLAIDSSILITKDGGVHWTPQYTATTPILLSFVSLHDGWASFGGRLFSTSDGGVTWDPTTTTFANIAWVEFGNTQIGWVYTAQGIFQTRDASVTWQDAPTPCNKEEFQGPLQFEGRNALRMICPIGGLAGIRPNLLFESSDGGEQWQLVRDYTLGHEQSGTLPVIGFINDMSFANSEQGWIIANDYGEVNGEGRYGIIARSNDGGKLWEQVQNTPMGEYILVQFTSAKRGYLVAHTSVDTTLYGTDDGGQTWQSLYQAAPGSLCGLTPPS